MIHHSHIIPSTQEVPSLIPSTHLTPPPNLPSSNLQFFPPNPRKVIVFRRILDCLCVVGVDPSFYAQQEMSNSFLFPMEVLFSIIIIMANVRKKNVRGYFAFLLLHEPPRCKIFERAWRIMHIRLCVCMCMY